jgi:hypothetical protein
MKPGFSHLKVLGILGLFLFLSFPQVQAKGLPHYFKELGLSRPGPTDPLEMRKEFLTVFAQTRSMWPPDMVDGYGNIVSGWISVPNIVGTGLWRSMVVHGKIVQPDFAQTGEEALNRFYSPGVYSEIKREGEEVPIVRLYRIPGSEDMNIVLVGLDLPDYFECGLPDKMDMGSYKSALEYISATARYLIPREESSIKLARKKFVPSPEDVSVVKSSEASLQVWEEGSFELPVEYKDKDFISETRLKKDQGDRKDGLKEVEFFIDNYYTIDVVEYYTPKKEYSLVKDYSTHGNQVTLQFKDKPTISSPPASLGVLTYVMFREADNKGWIYWDKGGDGVFDARKPIYWSSGGQSSKSSGGSGEEGGF